LDVPQGEGDKGILRKDDKKDAGAHAGQDIEAELEEAIKNIGVDDDKDITDKVPVIYGTKLKRDDPKFKF
jgi:hypothetical protein